MEILRPLIHYGLHYAAPLLWAYVLQPKHFWRCYLVFLGSMLVDLDHLLADPIFDPNRMSVGFHILHSYPAIACYVALLFWRKSRILAIALLFHMFTDWLDFQLLGSLG